MLLLTRHRGGNSTLQVSSYSAASLAQSLQSLYFDFWSACMSIVVFSVKKEAVQAQQFSMIDYLSPLVICMYAVMNYFSMIFLAVNT